jgi:nickel-dependent lactate racemase
MIAACYFFNQSGNAFAIGNKRKQAAEYPILAGTSMDIELKYGDGQARIPIPEKADVSILQPLRLPVLESLEDSLRATLNSPLGCDTLVKLLERRKPGTVVIAIPDETRPTPSKVLLVPLLELIRSNLKTRPAPAITILIGGGLHPAAAGWSPMMPEPPG